MKKILLTIVAVLALSSFSLANDRDYRSRQNNYYRPYNQIQVPEHRYSYRPYPMYRPSPIHYYSRPEYRFYNYGYGYVYYYPTIAIRIR